ncbi:MAG: hypothetical protein ACN6QY_21105 [Pseudomonas sp.]|uniref:hypothetical protein n=1 Tax=Pseudomonas sp. TaxID=306 RepID=UPI003D132218
MERIIRIPLALIAIAALGGCVVPTTVDSRNNIDPNNQDFVAVRPGNSDYVERETGKGRVKEFWDSMSNKEINARLPLERSYVSILKVDTENTLGYAGAKYTGTTGTYIVVLDYAKYRDEVTDKENLPCLVGVGVRIKATITTRKSGLDLGSLFAIGYAAKSGYLTGTIELTKIGIDSSHLSSAMPNSTEISDTSIQSAIQAIGAVRNRLYDDDTRLTPHVLAVQLAPKTRPSISEKNL